MEQDEALTEQESEEAQDTEVEAPDDWKALAVAAFEGSSSYLDSNYRPQWERNIRQWRSVHRTGSKYLSDTWKGKSRFFRPKTRTVERKSEAGAAAALFSTADVIDIEPYQGKDPSQKASAALWKEVINFRLTKTIPWFQTVMGAYQDAQVMSSVVSHQSWNTKKDCLSIEVRPLENIRIDPASDWTDPIESSPYLIDMLPMYVHEVKERQLDETAPWAPCSTGELLAAEAHTWDSTRMVREGQRTDPKEGGETGITDFSVVWVHRVIMRRKGMDWLYYMLGTQKLLTEPIPLSQAYPWLPAGERPYVMGICVIETHRVYPSSQVELQAPIQDEINDIVNQRRDNVRLVLDKRYFVKRHRQVDIRSLTRNLAGSVTMMDDVEGDVKPMEWNDVTGSSYQEEDRLNLDQDDLSGTFSGSSVMSNRKLNETVGGMNRLASDASVTGDYALKTFVETWYEPVLNQILLLEQFYESDEVIFAMAGEKVGLIEKFGISVLTDEFLKQQLTLSINVGMGSSNPLTSIERFMAGLNALTTAFGEERISQDLDFEEVSAELFGKLGYKDGTRFFKYQGDNPEVQKLQQEIQKLQQQLAMKRDPAVDAATAEHKKAQALKVMVEALFGAAQASQIIAAIPETAAVADGILMAAGYQPPSPPGVDPNLPTAPGAQVVPIRQNTSPLQPLPPSSPSQGINQGIEGG